MRGREARVSNLAGERKGQEHENLSLFHPQSLIRPAQARRKQAANARGIAAASREAFMAAV